MTQFARFSAKYVCRTAKAHQSAKNAVSRPGDGVFIVAHVPLSDCGTGAVTSVRVTPLENVRLLRMVEKSLDMLR